jgi:hypothetical protein
MAFAYLPTHQADALWSLYKGALLRWHCFILVASCVALLRGEPLVAPVIVPHLLGLFCTWGSPLGSRRLAAYANLAATLYSIAVGGCTC